ncbi:glycosyltransferase family 2 protein [Komagataeibacter xylinus]|uniref:glycosyltransferase family 2 protein n=1 Tax=Komagataeibacter xylinus TaxID=28448 RepID=UPI00280AB000|nr:glycosyltransferase family 2 protein [Komagataeibacter xylinus]
MLNNSRILVFIPMYNCAPQIPRVIKQLTHPDVAKFVDGVVCIDNRSTDQTSAAAAEGLASLHQISHRTLLRNNDNYGLGGSHKVAIEFGRKHGYDFLIVLHGDDQGSIIDLLPYLEDGSYLNEDFLMGARFMKGSRLEGYSLLRTMANKAFNFIFSVISRRRLYDLGSGLNLFRLSSFDDDFQHRFADDLTFNYYLILTVAARPFRLRFFPLTWREDDQVSNAKLSRMGFQILNLLGQRVKSLSAFEKGEHRAIVRDAYPSTVVGFWEGDQTSSTVAADPI